MSAVANSPHAAPRLDLAKLLADRATLAPLPVRALTLDSRRVAPGDAFVAIAGRSGHGLSHALSACAAGAAVVLWDAADAALVPVLPPGVRGLGVPGLAHDLAGIAARAYGDPSARAAVCGVTGTNGKTTTAWLLASAFAGLGEPGAYVGTVGVGILPRLDASSHTTPDVIGIQASLASLVACGARHVAMEVSSQGLEQGRTQAVRMHAAGFTNLTRDHLDYHGTMEAYGAAKARLFSARGLQHAVINVADPFGVRLAAGLAPDVRLTTVQPPGTADGAFLAARDIRATAAGLRLECESHLGAFVLNSPLVGRFNAENLLVALGLLLANDVALDAALGALATATAPPGRMELWRLANGAVAVVDYAHTPDALAKALSSLREHCAGELWCVFGCGGERDRGKRPQMGAVAERLADRIVLTDDNPRGEPSAQIIDEILAGIADPSRVAREPDRARAIASACAAARPGDAVLVAGKGHEDTQTHGGVSAPYSDRVAVAAIAGRRA